jgi:hypothetical protein
MSGPCKLPWLLPMVRAARLDWADARPFLDADTPEALRELELHL